MLKKIKKRIVDLYLLYFPIVRILYKKPRYIKYIFSWMKSPLDNEIPWMNFDTKEWLDKNLDKDMIIFEYGSGGSTFYFAKKVKKIISVEHDWEWYKIVKDKLNRKKVDNSELYCCPPEEDLDSKENFYYSFDEHYKNKSFKKYVEKINDYPNNSFDLVVVDGRARNSCLKNVLPKVKNNGYVLLDNSERKEYVDGIKILDKFEVKIFFGPGYHSNGQWEARIWQIKK